MDMYLLVITVVIGLRNLYAETATDIRPRKSEKRPTDEQRLYKYLMKNYDPNTRPVFNASHPVNVSIGITLTQIFDVEWKDEKLHWDPKDYNGLEVFRMPCTSIWRPDIVLYNSADDYNNGYMQALAMVKYDGTVFWPPIVKLRSTCNIDITYFPFDDQKCKLKMGSWAYDGFQVDVYTREHPVDLSLFVSNGEWELLNVEAIRNVIIYPCCIESFPDVTFVIHIRRRTLYYMYNVIIPCIMLSTLTLTGFWMRPDSGEKVTLGLTVLLAFSVFMLLVAESMPATSSFVPLIGIYLTTIMSMTSMSVILAVLTSNINHRGLKGVQVPSCLRSLLTIMSKVMCMRLVFIKHKANNTVYQGMNPHARNPYHYISTTVSSGDSGCLTEYENGDANTQNMRHNSTHLNRQPSQKHDINQDVQLILQKLDLVLSKEEEKEHSELLIKQWVEVAEIIDRFFFWIFVIGTLFTSFFLLLVYPLFKGEAQIIQPST